MASKLLNVLNNIEQGRQDIVAFIKSKEINIHEEASFEEISDILEENFFDVNVDPIIHHDPLDYVHPENDPNLWRKPTWYPDLESIFNSLENQPIPNSNLEAVPIGVILLDTEHSSVKLTAIQDNAFDSDNCIKFGLTLTASASDYDWNQRKSYLKYVTSDGVSYEFNRSNITSVVEHTWDTSKDLGESDHKYRLIYVYNYDKYVIDKIPGGATVFKGTDVLALVAIRMYQTYIDNKFEYLLLLSNTYECFNYGIMFYTGSAFGKTGTTDALLHLGMIEDKTASGVNVNIQTLRINQNISLIAPHSQINIQSRMHAFKYIKCKSVRQYQPSTSSGYWFGNNLRYLEIDPEEQRAVVHSTSDAFQMFAPLNCNLIENLREIPKASIFYCKDVLDFESLESVKGNITVSCSILGLEMLTTLGYQIQGTFKTLLAPNLVELTASIATTNSQSVPHYIKAPSLKRIIGSVNIACIVGDFSSLERLDYATCFNSPYLEYLKLPEGFKFNLTFTNNQPRIRRDFILELFNKCAELEEEETYTLKLGTQLLSMMLPEEIEIATNKGWTVIA